MPAYSYRCPANGRTLEVRHGMSEQLTTWGELCKRAEVDLEETPADTPVERMLSAFGVLRQSGTEATPRCDRPSCMCFDE